MPVKSRIRSSGDMGPITRAVTALTKKRLLIGIPGDAPARPAEPGEKGTPPNNALVGYVLETGDPNRNLPARPFLVPGVENAKPEIVKGMEQAVLGAFSGNMGAIDAGFQRAGLAAVVAVKQKMQEGPFAPLSDRTIRERAERRYKDTGKLVGAKANREARDFLKLQAQGTPDAVLHDAGLAQPLIDTRSLITSIQYIVKDR